VIALKNLDIFKRLKVLEFQELKQALAIPARAFFVFGNKIQRAGNRDKRYYLFMG
jgi:hypothetical protein